MFNGLVPNYLCSLVPTTFGSNSTYNLRNSNDLSNIACKTNRYMKSFLRSTIKVWNSLSQFTRETDSLSSFKRILDKDKPIPNELFFYGERRLQILHARLRNNCSDSKQHLFWKNIEENPLCRCRKIESNKHYFFVCKFYRSIRTAFTHW